ncbi:hypothetical protein MP228_007996 [Amoeboaphelidium protococcarum]|nr:hypothetical protein MP228_007996 [Amoeboaphelidium protococcarum]
MQGKVWRVCIVGSGPAGFYTASRLLKQSASSAALKSKNVRLEVDMLEGLPVPYGLVRYGISPDHPEVKSVVNKFNEMAVQEGTGPGGSGRFEFMGNVRIRTSSSAQTSTSPVRETRQSFQSTDIQWGNSGVRVQDLLKRYHSIVLAYGSSKDRRLNIQNEDAGGVISARQFVAWYNGYPSQIATVKSDEVIDKNSQSQASPDGASDSKSTDPMQSNKEHVMMSTLLKQNSSAVIIGQGNVALDIARVLLIPNPRESLGKTDMPDYAVNALVDSKVRDVTIVGRRGPLNVSFTAKELRELDVICKQHGIQCLVLDADVNEQLEKLKRQSSSTKSKQERGRIRVLEVLNRFQNSDKDIDGNGKASGRSLAFRFFKSPAEINVSKDKDSNKEVISEVKFATTRYTNEDACDQVEIVPNCPAEGIKTNFLIKSIGYQSVGVDGLPFDSKRGRLPHTQGRVLSSAVPDDESNSNGYNVMNGVYVAGWLKTGPTGVIASTMYDAYQTADCLLQDIESDIHLPNDQVPARQDTIQWLQSQIGSRPVTFEDWKVIEDEEIRRGKLLGKPYEKITKTDEILQILHKHHNKVKN